MRCKIHQQRDRDAKVGDVHAVAAQARQSARRYRLEMGLLDFVANAVLEWILYHAIRWIEDHKLLTGFIVILIGGALLLLFR